MIPAPTRNAPMTPRSERRRPDRRREARSPTRGPAKLEASESASATIRYGSSIRDEVLGEVADRVPEPVELLAEVERGGGRRHGVGYSAHGLVTHPPRLRRPMTHRHRAGPPTRSRPYLPPPTWSLPPRARTWPRRASAPTSSPSTDSRSGTTSGTRVTTCSPTASSIRRSATCSVRADRRARRRRRRGALRPARPRGVRRRRRRVPSLVWFAAAASAWLLTGRIAFLSRSRSGSRHCSPPTRRDSRSARSSRPSRPLRARSAASSRARRRCALARRRASAGHLAGARLGFPLVALNLPFPVGGDEPFVFSAFVALPLLAALALWLVPGEYRALRIGAVLYALSRSRSSSYRRRSAATSPVSAPSSLDPCCYSSSGRAGAGSSSRSRCRCSTGSWSRPSATSRKAAGDDSTEAAFYEPLVAELDRLAAAGEPFRVEIPPTKNRWEAVYVAARYPIARGWLRQLEHDDFDLFMDGNLDAAAYRGWLDGPRGHLRRRARAPRDVPRRGRGRADRCRPRLPRSALGG